MSDISQLENSLRSVSIDGKRVAKDIGEGNKKVKWKQLTTCLDILRSMNIVFSTEVTFDDLKDSKNLRFDIMPIISSMNEDIHTSFNIICMIEVDGAQHFKKGGFGEGAEDFIKQKYHDYMKVLYCRKRSISLLRISYKEEGSELSLITNYINIVKTCKYVEMYSNLSLYADQKAITTDRLEYIKDNKDAIITSEPPKPNRIPVKISSKHTAQSEVSSSISISPESTCRIG